MKGFVSMNFLLGSLSLNTHMLAQTNTPTQINPFINMNFLLGSLSFNTHVCTDKYIDSHARMHIHTCTHPHALKHIPTGACTHEHKHTSSCVCCMFR
jgi:hypothetical protein